MIRALYDTGSTFTDALYAGATPTREIAPAPEPVRIAPVLTVRQPVLVSDLTSQTGAATSVPLPARGDTTVPESLLPGRIAGPQPLSGETVDSWRYRPGDSRGDRSLATLNLAPAIVSEHMAPGRVSDPTSYGTRTPPAIVVPGKLHTLNPEPMNGAPPSRFPAWVPAALGALALFAL